MSTIFLFEDGHRNVIDENGGLEPIEYIVDQDEFVVEAIATHSEYLKKVLSRESSPACSIVDRMAKRRRRSYERSRHKT